MKEKDLRRVYIFSLSFQTGRRLTFDELREGPRHMGIHTYNHKNMVIKVNFINEAVQTRESVSMINANEVQ
jgi:hypothetical protein